MGAIAQWLELSHYGLTTGALLAVVVLWRALESKDKELMRSTTELVGLAISFKEVREAVDRHREGTNARIDRLEDNLRAVLDAYLDRIRESN